MVARLMLVLVAPVGLVAVAAVEMLVVPVLWVREVMVGLRRLMVLVVVAPEVVGLCRRERWEASRPVVREVRAVLASLLS